MDQGMEPDRDTVISVISVRMQCVRGGRSAGSDRKSISGTGGIAERFGKREDQEKPGQTEGDTDTGSKKSAEKKIWVYVCGAVNAPGVYELKEDARLYEAIELAGGVNQEAAPEVLNQARVLADGERIYVPKQDEAESYSLQDQGLESNAGTADTRGKININTAGKEELMTLPGIGEAKAEKILRYREEHGAFRSIEDVMQIEGIKEGVFNKIKEDITI